MWKLGPLLAATALLTLACASPPPGNGAGCVLGTSISCACVDGRTGAQTCLAGGAFSACVCARPDAGPSDLDAPPADVMSPALDRAPPDETPTPPDGARPDAPAEDTSTACAAGTVRCGGACVSLGTDAAHCGGCGRACNAGEVCAEGRCAPLPADCRAMMCPAGSYCDLGSGRCLGGCAFDEQCPQPGRCDASSHACECAAGRHRCGDACVLNASVATCGARCEACPAAPNATPVCVSETCDLMCAAGYHRCGSACVADADVATCGSRCAPCPEVANGRATCAAGACGVECLAGYHPCGGACVSNADTASCGSRCAPCPEVANGRATCAAGACGFECLAGHHRCGGACVRDDDTSACGASCAACPTVTGGAATCVAGACGFTCGAGLHACAGACARNDAPATCGARCAPCPARANATATCVAGACGDACNTGATECAGACVYTATDGAHCGACGRACDAGTTCLEGRCVRRCAGLTRFNEAAPLPGRVAMGASLFQVLAAGDVSGDGNVDLVALDPYTSGGSTVHLYLGYGDGEFAPRVTYATTHGAVSLDVGDLNNDRRADVALAVTGTSARVGVMYSAGAALMPVALTTTVRDETSISVVVRDVNRDGFADVVFGTAPASAGSPRSAALRLLLGSASGAFTAMSAHQTTVSSGGFPIYEVRDINGDDAVDILTLLPSSIPFYALTFRGTGDGRFPMTSSSLQVAGEPADARVADFDRNGSRDYAFVFNTPGADDCRAGVHIHRTRPDGTFFPRQCVRVGPQATTLVAEDFDGDGNPDIMSGSTSDDNVVLLQGDGTGAFTHRFVAPGRPERLVAADFNNDGRTDVAFLDAVTRTVRVLVNGCF